MRRLAIVTFVGLVVFGVSTAARADAGDIGNQIVLSGRVIVAPKQTAGTVVVFHGPVRVAGAVHGSVVVFDGDVSISGTVRDNVVAFNGDVTVSDGAHIGGDLVTRIRPSIAPGAVVQGDVRRLRNLSISFAWGARLAIWFAFTISTLVLGLILLALFRRPMEAVASRARARAGASVGWGVGLFFGLPIAAFLAILTVVGIPLGLALLLALWLVYTVGYTISLLILGRAILGPERSRFGAFAVGWGILRAAALVPFLGGFLWLAATVFGLGAMAAASRAKRLPARAVPPPPPTPPLSQAVGPAPERPD